MSDVYINIPAYGDPAWKHPVANSAVLPASGNNAGDARVTLDTNHIWIWSGSTWVDESGGGGGGGVTAVTASAPLSSSGGASPNISESQANTSTDGYLSSVDWNTFNNKQSGPLTGDITTAVAIATLKAIPNKVYVDFVSGNDSNTGTIVQPWKTLQHAYNSISPNINEPYVIYLSGGNNDSDVGTITGKPDTSIVADFPTQVNALTISGGVTNSNGVTFVNLVFTGAVSWTRNDSTTIGMTLINVEFFSGPTLKQTGSGTASITAIGSVFVNSEFLTGNGGFAYFSDCSFLGTTAFDDPGNAGSYLQFNGGYSGGAMTITGFYNPVYFAGFIHDAAFGASLTFVSGTGGFAAVEADSAGLPPTYTGTPSSITLLSLAQYESYTPADSSKWANPQPTTVKQALDRIAAVVGLSIPIP